MHGFCDIAGSVFLPFHFQQNLATLSKSGRRDAVPLAKLVLEFSVAVSLTPFLASLWNCPLFLPPSPLLFPFLLSFRSLSPLLSSQSLFPSFLSCGPLLTILGTQAHILRKARPWREAIVGVLADKANRSAHGSQQQGLGYNLRPSGDPSSLSARFPTEPLASVLCLAWFVFCMCMYICGWVNVHICVCVRVHRLWACVEGGCCLQELWPTSVRQGFSLVRSLLVKVNRLSAESWDYSWLCRRRAGIYSIPVHLTFLLRF